MTDKFVDITGVGKLVLTGLISRGEITLAFFQVRDSLKLCPEALKIVLQSIKGYSRRERRIVRQYARGVDIDREMVKISDRIGTRYLKALFETTPMRKLYRPSAPRPGGVYLSSAVAFWESSIYAPFTQVTTAQVWKDVLAGRFMEVYKGPSPLDYIKALLRQQELDDILEDDDVWDKMEDEWPEGNIYDL